MKVHSLATRVATNEGVFNNLELILNIIAAGNFVDIFAVCRPACLECLMARFEGASFFATLLEVSAPCQKI